MKKAPGPLTLVRTHLESCTLLADDPKVRALGCTCVKGGGKP